MVDEVCSFTLTVTRSPVVLTFSRYTAGLGVPVNGSMPMLAMIGLMRFSFFDRPQARADAGRSRGAASAGGGQGDPRAGGGGGGAPPGGHACGDREKRAPLPPATRRVPRTR